MIHDVIVYIPRQWHKSSLFTASALREVPNSTTGIPPYNNVSYMSVYVTIPRGPLAILKESRMGNIHLQPYIGVQPEK